jgi:vacuolar-type H+-ATPase subunit C/Vma6
MSPEFSKPLDKILKKEMNKMANEIKKNVPATVEDILAQFTVEEIEKMLATKRAPAEGSPVKVGNRVAIQTVTYHWVG